MAQSKQITLDGKVLSQDSDIEKAINNKVTSSFSIHMVHVKDSFGEIIKGKKYKAVFSSATESVHEILNCIVKECPEAVSSWLAKNEG